MNGSWVAVVLNFLVQMTFPKNFFE